MQYRGKRVKRETVLLLEILSDARHGDRDVAAAAARRIATNLQSVRTRRKMARRTRLLNAREMLTRSCDRTVRDNRRIREMAKAYGWQL